MVVKSDSESAPIGKRPANHPKKYHAADLPRITTKLIFNLCLLSLIAVAILIGPSGSQENLETMGIHIGPVHL